MKTIKIDAEKAFELMYELFKAKPWLNSGGVMTDEDNSSEDEALAFMLTLENAEAWGDCSAPARRVTNSLLLDFIMKLQTGIFNNKTWIIPAGRPLWRQATHLICAEIRSSHPHFARTH